MTFWSGLLFYIGYSQDIIPNVVKIAASLAIVFMNVSFFCYALYKFAKEFVQDYKAHKQGIIKADLQDEYDRTHVVPITTGANLVEKTDEPDDDDDDDFDPATSRQIRRGSLKHTRSTVHRVHSLHDEFHSHELALQVEQEKRQKKERRKTLHRVEVRAKLIRSKVMRKVRIFQQLDDTGLANLIEHMTIRNFKENEKIIEQGSVATCFYIITTGVVSVTQKTINDMVKGHEVARLNENSFFGENCFKMGSKIERVCNATVTAVGMVRTLAMENSVLEKLVEDGIIDRKDLEKGIAEEQERRERMTKVKLLMERSKFAIKSNGGGERSLFS